MLYFSTRRRPDRRFGVNRERRAPQRMLPWHSAILPARPHGGLARTQRLCDENQKRQNTRFLFRSGSRYLECWPRIKRMRFSMRGGFMERRSVPPRCHEKWTSFPQGGCFTMMPTFLGRTKNLILSDIWEPRNGDRPDRRIFTGDNRLSGSSLSLVGTFN